MNTSKTWKLAIKALLGLFLGVSISGVAFAVLRAETTVPVFDGHIRSNSVLSDDSGRVFLEITKDTYAYRPTVKQFYDGYLLAPEVLPAPDDALMPIMDEIVTFELYTADNIPVVFVDKKKRNIRGVKVLVSIVNPGQPSLWQYDGDDGVWRKLGGRLVEDVEGAPSVFVTYINTTGIYGVFDELPGLGGYGLDPDQVVDVNGDDIYSSQPVITPQEELEQLQARMAEIEEFLASFEGGELDEMMAEDMHSSGGTDGVLGELALVNELGELIDGAPDEVAFPYSYEDIDNVDTASSESGDDVNTNEVRGNDNIDGALDDELNDLVIENGEEAGEVDFPYEYEEGTSTMVELDRDSVGVGQINGINSDGIVATESEQEDEGENEEPVQSAAPLPDQLPQSGPSWLWIVFSLVVMSIVGYEVYDRYFSLKL